MDISLSKREVAPNNIAMGKEFSCEGLVNDRDLRRIELLILPEFASFANRRFHGGEVVRAHPVLAGIGVLIRGGDISFDRDIATGVAIRQNGDQSSAHRPYPRDLGDRVPETITESDGLSRRVAA